MKLSINTMFRKNTFSAATPLALRKKVRAWIQKNSFGASHIGAMWQVTGHKTIIAMSYNGRFWGANGKEVQP